MKMKFQAKDKRLVAVAFNIDGEIDKQTLSELRKFGLKYSDSTQTVIFDDPSTGGQAAFVFEINDVEHAGIVKRIGYRLRKLKAAASAYIRHGVFVRVVIKGERSVFPVHGA
ncbi:MAG: hypothetical protein ACI4HH_00595 [Hominenteromicrobium mulieris]